MRIVPLASVANQAFSVTLLLDRWVIRLGPAGGNVMFADISRNGSVLVSGMRVLAGEPLVPYRYLEEGNFLFISTGNELPFWSEFGISQTLVYVSKSELEVIRANPLTVADIDMPRVVSLTDDQGFYLTTDDGELLDAVF